MAGIDEPHDWAQMPGGVKCQTCGVFISDASIGANKPTIPANSTSDLNTALDAVVATVDGL